MVMSQLQQEKIINCEVCGSRVSKDDAHPDIICCNFCGFRKKRQGGDDRNNQLITAKNINQFFKLKYDDLKKNETFRLNVPVRRFYKCPVPKDGQINFFKSKNIMFLLEQHGFQMVSRKSRFSTELSLIVRKV